MISVRGIMKLVYLVINQTRGRGMQGFDNRSGHPMDAARACEDLKLSTTEEQVITCADVS